LGMSLLVETPTRRCSKCKLDFPATLQHFYPSKLGSLGLQSRCKGCSRLMSDEWRKNNTARVRETQTAWDKANKYRRRDAFLRRTHGIGEAEYQARLAAQEHKCAICGAPPKPEKTFSLDVDHDHSTNEVRGLLCNACNQGLGYFKDNPERLRAAALYLETVPDRAC